MCTKKIHRLTNFLLISSGLDLYLRPGLRLRLLKNILASDGEALVGSLFFWHVLETTFTLRSL